MNEKNEVKPVNAIDYIKANYPNDTERMFDILDKLAESVIDSPDADVEPDETCYSVYVSGPVNMVDNGIGAYEYFGCRGVDHQYEFEPCDYGDFGTEVDNAHLADVGLNGIVLEGDIDYSGCEEDGDTAHAINEVTINVIDPAKFDAFLKMESAKIAA